VRARGRSSGLILATIVGIFSLFSVQAGPAAATFGAGQYAAPLPQNAPQGVAGDIDEDGFINQLDLQVLAANFGALPFAAPRADINGDKVVDVLDLATLGRNFGQLAPQPLKPMKVERAFPDLTFQRLTNLVQPEDGRDLIFVTEQAGRILVFPNNQRVSQADTFLDISGQVGEEGNEEGLLGLVFDPDYQNNGYLYVYYSATPGPRRTVLSRFSVSQSNPQVADPQSEVVILEIPQPYSNHKGGQLAFGLDGYLYLGLGDGGSGGDPQGNGQNKGTLLGKLLRVDVRDVSGGQHYRIPPDNPFVGIAGAREEIWAYGLRNPWRFSLDVETGLLWLADVGQNEWEEINLVEKGLNYGWNIMEGNHCFSPRTNCNRAGLELPLVEYGLSGAECSAIGGYVYWGRGMPSLLGAYLYGDFCSGKIWGLRYDGKSLTEQMLLVDSDLSITSFGQDEDRNLYILSRNTGIYRLVPAQ